MKETENKMFVGVILVRELLTFLYKLFEQTVNKKDYT